MLLVAACLAICLAIESVVTVVISRRLDHLLHLFRAIEDKQLDLEMLNHNMRNLWRRELDKLQLPPPVK